MESLPARPGSPLPPLSGRASYLLPTRRAPIAPPSGSRPRPPLTRTKTSTNISARDLLASPPPRSVGRSARASLPRSKSSADLPSLLAPAPPPASKNRPRPTRNDDENLLAAFPDPPPLSRRATDPLRTRQGAPHLTRERPSAHQAKRATVSTTSPRRSPPSARVAEIEEATIASSPVICPALPADLVPWNQRHLRRSPPRSPRALRAEPKRGSPLKRGWSADDILREMEQEDEIDLLRGADGWFMQALQECAEDEDEDGYFKGFKSFLSVQEIPDDCDTDYEEDPFYFDRNVTYRH